MSPSEPTTVSNDVTDGVGNNGGASLTIMPKNEIDDIGQGGTSLAWAAPTSQGPDVPKTEQIDSIGQPNHMVPQMPSVSTNDNPAQANLTEFKPFNQVLFLRLS